MQTHIDEAGYQVTVTDSGAIIRELPPSNGPAARAPLSKVDIMRRITPTEWSAFTASTDHTAQYALAVFNATALVHPDDALTIQLFGALESLGILGAGRSAEILA